MPCLAAIIGWSQFSVSFLFQSIVSYFYEVIIIRLAVYWALKAPFTTLNVLVGSVDQDQAAQNVQPGHWSTLSALLTPLRQKEPWNCSYLSFTSRMKYFAGFVRHYKGWCCPFMLQECTDKKKYIFFFMFLRPSTLTTLKPSKVVFCGQCRSRSDCTERAFWSWSALSPKLLHALVKTILK